MDYLHKKKGRQRVAARVDTPPAESSPPRFPHENPGHRIIGSYAYRGTPYQITQGNPPRARVAALDFVTLIDVVDHRFRGERSVDNAHGGYNLTFGDGSVYFFEDEAYEVEFMVSAGGGTMNGRHSASNDESVYYFLGDQR